jgi:hypothetical protein
MRRLIILCACLLLGITTARGQITEPTQTNLTAVFAVDSAANMTTAMYSVGLEVVRNWRGAGCSRCRRGQRWFHLMAPVFTISQLGHQRLQSVCHLIFVIFPPFTPMVTVL